MHLTPGAVIAGRYRLEHKVGAGGMGEVWAAEHCAVGSRVAIKTLLSSAVHNHEIVARFKREALILGKIRSDHVARVVDFVTDKVFGPVLVMEFIEGAPLNHVLQERTLSVEETIHLGVDIASALADLHQAHIVHRDLKPGNLILQALKGGGFRAVVVDFGVSRLMSAGDLDDDDEITGITRVNVAVGTIEYMAPEQILNARAVTSGSDIYAAGAILFRAAAGHHAFGDVDSDQALAQTKLLAEAPALDLARRDALAEQLGRVVARALRRRPADRYQSAEELLRDLRPLREKARLPSLSIDVDRELDASGPNGLRRGRAVGEPAATATRASLPDASSGPSPGTEESTAARTGVPLALVVVAVAAALIGGALVGSGLIQAPTSITALTEGATRPSATPAPSSVLAPGATTPTSIPPPGAEPPASAAPAPKAAPPTGTIDR